MRVRMALLLVWVSAPGWGQSLVPSAAVSPLPQMAVAATPRAAPLIPGGGGSSQPGSAMPDGAGVVAPLGRPEVTIEDGPDPNRRCSPSGAHCIALDSYIPDVCRVIETAAKGAGIDPHFFARLIWRESLFDAGAVSHAGAQGIAQFMPATARERGLADPFNPAEALFASAALLRDLKQDFGNLGLAAAAYNGGPGRVSRFVRGASRLPKETRDYVAAITGFAATDWRDKAPKPDYRLDGDTPFQEACQARARGRSLDAFRPGSSDGGLPWGAVVAAHRSSEIAAYRAARLQRQVPPSLQGVALQYRRTALPGLRGRPVTAQYSTPNEEEARHICRALVEAGIPCLVHRN